MLPTPSTDPKKALLQCAVWSPTNHSLVRSRFAVLMQSFSLLFFLSLSGLCFRRESLFHLRSVRSVQVEISHFPASPGRVRLLRHLRLALRRSATALGRFSGCKTTSGHFPSSSFPSTEEVIRKSTAIWFSPQGSHLAFLSFNDTALPRYKMTWFGEPDNLYVGFKPIIYPKAGDDPPAPSPDVKLYICTKVADTTGSDPRMLTPPNDLPR